MMDTNELKRLVAQGSLPPIVATLIAENESLRGSCKAMGADMGKLTRERNSFRSQAEKAGAENAGLRTGYEAYERVNAELRKALTTIREESHDIGACECAADALADSRKGEQP
ncbi:hypothetical protein D3C84_1070860 [compost metagenome]